MISSISILVLPWFIQLIIAIIFLSIFVGAFENETIAGLFLLICFCGWIINILKFISIIDNVVTGVMLVRMIGIPLFPIGIIIGYI